MQLGETDINSTLPTIHMAGIIFLFNFKIYITFQSNKSTCHLKKSDTVDVGRFVANEKICSKIELSLAKTELS